MKKQQSTAKTTSLSLHRQNGKFSAMTEEDKLETDLDQFYKKFNLFKLEKKTKVPESTVSKVAESKDPTRVAPNQVKHKDEAE